MKQDLSLICNSLSETKTLAGCFASLLRASLVIGLDGLLGVGKSAFSRFVIQSAVGTEIDVPSPTFTLVQTYESANGLPVMHMDLYRLEAPEQVFELGVEESFYEAANLIEWPSKMGAYWPSDAVTIEIAFSEGDSRHVSLSAPEAFINALSTELAKVGLEISAS